MESILFFQYIIIGLIVSLGPFTGKLLSKIAPEELASSRNFLIILKKCLFLSLLAVLFFTISELTMRVFVVLLALYYIYDVFKHKLFDKNNYYLLYTALGIFLGFVEFNNILIPAFLAFLIGIPTALLQVHKRINVFVKIFIVFVLFYVASFLIYNKYILAGSC